ncbi:MAG: 1-deoxy-D-xylulose-5-phosphate reductoisomerase [Mogibacterium sp.]|nr:1-deoxy-D-xylulose-5-phosphate reductoisomerase [Mogibacterium sp.]
MKKKKILILGSTGSIGTQALEIIREHPEQFEVAGLTCRSRIRELREQIREFRPSVVCVSDASDARALAAEFPALVVLTGEAGLREITSIDADIVLNALMGISGLEPTWHAIRNHKDIAFANKETLVAGGALIMEEVRKQGIRLFPVDSEHSAIFQCLEGNRGRAVRRILLTASGGPFRKYTLEELEQVTLTQALKHPKWTMGSKITIDSATMMNKGLEVIEARWLFDVPASRIEIHVHPESIVHSMVEFEDTSVIAQMGLPDMKIPIGLAFSYPDRLAYGGESLDFFTTGKALHFERPRREVFRCIDLAYEALEEGGSAPAYLNGANEALVGMFLREEIRFLDIQRVLDKLMSRYRRILPESVEEILEVDRQARRDAADAVRAL